MQGAVWGKDWYGITWLHLCIYSDRNVCVMLVEVTICKDVFLYGLFFVKLWNFVKESITHLNMSAKREHRK